MAEPRRAKSALRVNGGSRVGWNGMPHSSPVTADRTRRCWADREERYLLATLKELVSHGWKSDNGFRWGYLFKLEEAMRREFPTCGLRANPHIQSKIHSWKKNYGAVAQLLDKSGVGFNINGDNKIDCDEYVWAEIIKADPSARAIRNKSWPYYEEWKIVFGKDRATGVGATDTERANSMYAPNIDGGNIGSGYGSNYEGDEPYEEVGGNERSTPNGAPDNIHYSSPVGSASGKASKKRVQGDALDVIVDVLTKMHEDTNARLEYLATRIGYEFDVTKARKELFVLISAIPELTLSQVFKASDAILAKGERLEYFMSLPESPRHAYVWHALENYVGN